MQVLPVPTPFREPTTDPRIAWGRGGGYYDGYYGSKGCKGGCYKCYYGSKGGKGGLILLLLRLRVIASGSLVLTAEGAGSCSCRSTRYLLLLYTDTVSIFISPRGDVVGGSTYISNHAQYERKSR